MTMWKKVEEISREVFQDFGDNNSEHQSDDPEHQHFLRTMDLDNDYSNLTISSFILT
jgi:hypothetical protein